MKYLKRKETGIYEARMRLHPTGQMIYRSMRTRDKEVAQKRMDELYRQLERESCGVASTTQKEKTAAEKPLLTHMKSFITDQRITCDSERYLLQVEKKLIRIFNECNWSHIKDIDKRSFNQWRTRNESLAPSTLNQYLCALTGFIDWLLDNEYIERSPLDRIKRARNTKWVEDTPRALTREEVQALLDVAGVRRTLYATAILTGLRRNELRQLKISDIKLGNGMPHIVVPSSIAKNGRERRQPLHGDLIDAMRELKQHKGASERVFQIPTWDTFHKDLKRAGISKRDEQGRKVSFHSLRHTYCTSLQILGVEPRTVQELMGHSDQRLTNKTYTDSYLLPVADAVNKIPSYTQPPHIPPHISGSEGHNVTQTGSDMTLSEFAQLIGNDRFCRFLTQCVAEGKMVGDTELEWAPNPCKH